MKREYEAFMNNHTWQTVNLPKTERAIGCKWVFTVKRDANGQVQRYMARLVAKSCSQQYEINYSETFLSVSNGENSFHTCSGCTVKSIFAPEMEFNRHCLHETTMQISGQRPSGWRVFAKEGLNLWPYGQFMGFIYQFYFIPI